GGEGLIGSSATTSLRRYAPWATASFASIVFNLRFIGFPRPLLLASPACGRPSPVRRAEARRFQQHEGRKQRRPVPGSHRDVTLITGADKRSNRYRLQQGSAGVSPASVLPQKALTIDARAKAGETPALHHGASNAAGVLASLLVAPI